MASKDTRMFTVFFIFLGNLIFTNLFIGIVIENLDRAQEEEQTFQTVKKTILAEGKKAYLLRRQHMEQNRHMQSIGASHKEQGKEWTTVWEYRACGREVTW